MNKDYENLQEGIAKNVAATIWLLAYDTKENKLANISFTAESLQGNVNELHKKNYTIQQIRSGLISLQRSTHYDGQLHQIKRDNRRIVWGNYIPAEGILINNVKPKVGPSTAHDVVKLLTSMESKVKAFDAIAKIVATVMAKGGKT